jgi:hypothetical protein
MVDQALGVDRDVRARVTIKARDAAGNATVKKRTIRLSA